MLASEDVLKLYVQGFKSRELFNHCPHEEGTSAGTIKRELPFAELELNEAQWARVLMWPGVIMPHGEACAVCDASAGQNPKRPLILRSLTRSA